METKKDQPLKSGVGESGNIKQDKKGKNKTTVILAVLIGALVILIGVLAWLLVERRQDAEEIQELTFEKYQLIDELEELSTEYEILETDNDSMRAQIESQKEEIEDLIGELRQTRIESQATIREYEKELGTLRDVLKSYIVQVDSLNQANIELREENVQAREQIAKTESELQHERQAKEELSERVKKGSVLMADNIEALTINDRGRERRLTRWVDRVQVCFTIRRNTVAEPGEREVFLKIIRPDGLVLATSSDNKIEFEGDSIMFSASRTVNYENDDLDACIYYTDDGSLISGDYNVEIYAEGHKIGTTQFSLR